MNENMFSDIFRPKSRKELILLSSIVCGIEFCYSAETAFVTPTLLMSGLPINCMTIIWCLSPLIGFFVSPLLGSLSDACRSSYGRRRPFIVVYSLGIIFGLVLVPNSDYISNLLFGSDSHSWSVFLTILGAVLLDFCCDACQSPSRALMFEVTIEDDHSIGLSTFTIMAGIGGAIGYLIGGIGWENLIVVQEMFGSDHKRIVFLLCAIAFIVCALLSITIFQEIPLNLLPYQQNLNNGLNYQQMTEESVEMTVLSKRLSNLRTNSIALTPNPKATFLDYVKSIVQMPDSLRVLCLTNFFSWMSLICYSLYFTDFVAEAVFGGDPTSEVGSESYQLYEKGVKFGCICMTLYSISCSVYSYFFESLNRSFETKTLYVGSGVVYALGMLVIAITGHRITAMVFSVCAGIQYSTLFTMPYVLIAKYHKTFSEDSKPRGLGTDIAVVGSMVFLAQFILSLCMGTVIDFFGSKCVPVYTASALSACSAWFATKIHYICD